MDGKESQCFSLLISRQGVAKLTPETIPLQHARLRKTTVPIQFGKQYNSDSAKLRHSDLDSSVTSDLGTSFSSSNLPSPGSPERSSKFARSTSPILINYHEKRPSLIRQNTFTESSLPASWPESSVLEKKKTSEDREVQTEVNETNEKTEVALAATQSQTESLSIKECGLQCSIKQPISHIETQTVQGPTDKQEPKKHSNLSNPILTTHAHVQTEQTSSKQEVTIEQTPVLSRLPCVELTVNSTQTESTEICTSAVQTSKNSSRVTSPKSAQNIDRTGTFVKDQTFTDEIVCRVLLEHADTGDETRQLEVLDEINVRKQPIRIPQQSSGSDPGPVDLAQNNRLGDQTHRAMSDTQTKGWSDEIILPLDMGRSVNYMDLSKLGNEGETPNSEEIWVNVEDDNKFLTSDTETYSVATDKVSTMATIHGHVSNGNTDMSHLMRSVSETELLELGNESIMSDLDGQQISAQQLAVLMRHEMEPVKQSLHNTDQTITGIAGSLYNIQDGVNSLCCNITQMKAKILSNGENELSMFDANDENFDIVKNGHPNGDTDELVDTIMLKLEKILRLRDEQLEGAINKLKDDNSVLKQELELYQFNKSNEDGSKNNELEMKMQELLESMKVLKSKRIASTSSSVNSADTKKSSDSRKKLRKRSKSKGKEKSNGERNRSNHSTASRKYPREDSTSSDDEDCDSRDKNNPEINPVLNNSLQTLKTYTDTEQQTVSVISDSKEIQTGTLQTSEASTFTEIHSQDATTEMIEEPLTTSVPDIITEPKSIPVLEPDSNLKETKSKPKGSNKSTKKTSKPEPKSPVKKSLKFNKQKRPLCKEATLDEVTDSLTIQGPGIGADGGSVSTTSGPVSADQQVNVEVKSNPKVESIIETKEELVVEESTKEPMSEPIKEKEKKEKRGSLKGKPTMKVKETKTKIASKGRDKSIEAPSKSNNVNDKSNTIPKKTNKVKGGNKTKEVKIEESPTKCSKDPNLTPASAVMSKVIEGDDFKITITSNQEMQSCELSDMEDGGSPKKKIVVTPKTPDKKKPPGKEEKQEATAGKTKGGRIPISKQYIKTRAELPAPEQFPSARPPAEQIPTPSLPYSSMSPSCPIFFDSPGFNHNMPPTPTQDYSICSNTYPISGRNTEMSMEGEVITMMIKQESRDSNVYDAPSSIPDFRGIRESPDGAYSYIIDGPVRSSMSNFSELRFDIDEESSDGVERDVIMEFVMMEEAMESNNFKSKGPSPFRGYTERMKRKVIRELVKKPSSQHAPIKPKLTDNSVTGKPAFRQNHRRKLWRARSHSVSTEKLNKINSTVATARQLINSKRNCFSTDRLPMLTPSEEDRIIRIKKYEDDTLQLNETKRHYNLRKANKSAFLKQAQEEVMIYEGRKSESSHGRPSDNDVMKEGDSGIESQTSKESNSDAVAESSSSDRNDSAKENRHARLEPISQSSKRIMSPHLPPLSVECFIVSRGWQVDQAQLTKALAKLDNINFVRMQVSNTMNRVLENIRPDNNVVLIHIGTQEISEACHSISNEESIGGNTFYYYFTFSAIDNIHEIIQL